MPLRSINCLTNSKRLLYYEVMMQQASRTAKVDCPSCQSSGKRFGRHRNGLQRYRCTSCRKTYTEPHEKPLGAMTVPMEKATLALQLLIEGTSIRSTERVTGLHRDTILRLLVLAGERCEKLLGRMLRNVPVEDVQCDEIWGYVFKKEGNKTPEEADSSSVGDAYTFVAVERNTKLVLNFTLGRRDQTTTDVFIEGLRDATASQRFQLSTDGWQPIALRLTPAFTTALTSECWSNSTQRRPAKRSATALLSVLAAGARRSWATLTERESAHPTSNARTSPCECRSAA